VPTGELVLPDLRVALGAALLAIFLGLAGCGPRARPAASARKLRIASTDSRA